MWLGEQITQRGIGNGISLLITVGILADLPKALADAYALVFLAPAGDNMVVVKAILMVALFLLVVGGIIAVTQAQRKIPVQYAKRMVGRKVFGGQSSFLPLKVNYAGVMPVIAITGAEETCRPFDRLFTMASNSACASAS